MIALAIILAVAVLALLYSCCVVSARADQDAAELERALRERSEG